MSASTAEVAQKLVDLCKQGKFDEAMNATYANDIVSVEPMAHPPMPAETRGLEGVRKKGEWWVANHDIHALTTDGPYIHGDKFVVFFTMDVTFKPTGKRMKASEAGVYTVTNGKVSREEFYMQPQPPAK